MNAAVDNPQLQNLYRELILDHATKPRNFGRLAAATHNAEGINPLCGDRLSLYLCIDAGSRIDSISFEGSGCAISLASASLLTETVKQLCVADAQACFTAFTQRLTQGTNPEALPAAVGFDKLHALDGVREHPSRIKCATLAWHALHAALHQQPLTTTE
ncbi:MAG TPA: SUF system NifU family Fe-S cluster assembly protein [Woeseiaceae bacterium]|nr:SUF system NifU family Fe-S cluster assembly protein [Woeseiaceae bacterium]